MALHVGLLRGRHAAHEGRLARIAVALLALRVQFVHVQCVGLHAREGIQHFPGRGADIELGGYRERRDQRSQPVVTRPVHAHREQFGDAGQGHVERAMRRLLRQIETVLRSPGKGRLIIRVDPVDQSRRVVGVDLEVAQQRDEDVDRVLVLDQRHRAWWSRLAVESSGRHRSRPA